jgi:hypothetical protein
MEPSLQTFSELLSLSSFLFLWKDVELPPYATFFFPVFAAE